MWGSWRIGGLYAPREEDSEYTGDVALSENIPHLDIPNLATVPKMDSKDCVQESC
jgi:hypothetical protein